MEEDIFKNEYTDITNKTDKELEIEEKKEDSKKQKTKLTDDEKLKKLDQKLNKLKNEKRRIKRKLDSKERKKRNHALIVFATQILSHYSKETQSKIINMSDEEIKNFVDTKLFRPKNPSEK